METSEDSYPFNVISHQCFNCGFFTATNCSYMELEDLNGRRKDIDLPPLKELPEQQIF